MNRLALCILISALVSYADCLTGTASGTYSVIDQAGVTHTANRCDLPAHIIGVSFVHGSTNDNVEHPPYVQIDLDIGPTRVLYYPDQTTFGSTMEQAKAFMALALAAQSENRLVTVIYLDQYPAGASWNVNFLIGLSVGN